MRRVFGDPAVRSSSRRRKRSGDEKASIPFAPGRDPKGIAEVLDDLTESRGWSSPLAKSDLLASWASIVGAETAEHSEPIGISDGVLSVRCDSTAWATQLRLMRSQITTAIEQRYPEAAISSVRFDGPGAPSWKRGPRSIPGRGPRDTYG
jgi:predicted nucleic acid-binding Zn ribbon protein